MDSQKVIAHRAMDAIVYPLYMPSSEIHNVHPGLCGCKYGLNAPEQLTSLPEQLVGATEQLRK